MFFTEQSDLYTIDEAKLFFESSSDPDVNTFRIKIVDPIIKVLDTSKGRNEYIKYGDEFIEINSEMLSKAYPTKPITYPQKYVDKIFEMFGFEKEQFKKDLTLCLKTVNGSDFKTVMGVQTNVIHTIALYYSDILVDRKLRDSARHQIGLTDYGHIFLKYFKKASLDEQVMDYTHSQLNGTWGLVKAENVMAWISHTVEVAYGAFRSRMALDMKISVVAGFVTRIRTSFNQNMRGLSNRYYANLDKREVGKDVKGDEAYLTNNASYVNITNNLMRIIKTDNIYKTKSKLYSNIAELKNVKADLLYKFAQKVEDPDIRNIMNIIFYVFLVRENHTLEDINSTQYISRITNFPTAIDRAIAGKPVILPMMSKYKETSEIVKAYICLIATYIMLRMNNARPQQDHLKFQ